MSILNKESLEFLTYLDRSLIANDNSKLFSHLMDYIPLSIKKYPSGTKCYDWVVPKGWKFHSVKILDSSGNEVFSSKNVLSVVNYSSSFYGKISLKDLLEHIHHSEARPYRTSYYKDQWGLCLTTKERALLVDDYYSISINTEFYDGDLDLAVASIEGKSNKEVMLSSYICHPNQSNDGVSGVLLLVELYNLLKDLDLKYTYNFYFWPETIGAIATLANKPNINDIEYALVSTTVGFGTPTYKKTYVGNHGLDNIAGSHISNSIDFTPFGSDERQYSSNGIKIPAGVITGTPYGEYIEYHTEDDNPNLVDLKHIRKMSKLYLKIILEYEQRVCYKTITSGCEPFLSDKGLYRSIGIPGHNKYDTIRNWVIYLSDGLHSTLDMSIESGIPIVEIEDVVETLIKRKVIYENIC